MSATTQDPIVQPPPEPKGQPQPAPDLRWIRLLAVLVVGNYGFWAYMFWALGRSENAPTPTLVAACLGLALSGAAALRWPGRAAGPLLLFAVLGWLVYARLGQANADAGLPLWAGLLFTTAFFVPALALAWLSRAIGRAIPS